VIDRAYASTGMITRRPIHLFRTTIASATAGTSGPVMADERPTLPWALATSRMA
jgi:hypothetical protein